MMPRGILLCEAAGKLKLKRIRPGYYRGKGTAMVDGKRVEVEVEKMEGWSRGTEWSSRASMVDTASELWNASDAGGASSYRDAKADAEKSLESPWKYYPGLGYAFA